MGEIYRTQPNALADAFEGSIFQNEDVEKVSLLLCRSPIAMHQELLIAGHKIGGPCDSSVGKETVKNPCTGRIFATVAEGGRSELSTAIASAHDAFETWRKSSLSDRIDLLSCIADLVKERREELANLAVQEIGKPITAAFAEVDRMEITFRLAAQELADHPEEWSPSGKSVDLSYDPRGANYSARVVRKPLGAILAITPYNWPYNLAAHKIAPALATGNTVVLKPSPLGALCSLSLAMLIHDAGCPAGVLNTWNGPTPILKRYLADERLAAISFTGSAKVGWELLAEFPRKVLTLELGGNASVVIDDSLSDAELARAAERCAWGAFVYAGQICISVQHIWVQASRLSQFRELFLKAMGQIAVGDPTDAATVVGPMMPGQMDRVLEWVDLAVKAGATASTIRTEGNRLYPILVEGAPEDSLVRTEEVFGPICTLGSFSDVSEALRLVNESKYGIHAGVFSRNEAFVDEFSDRVEAVGVVVNDVPTVRFDSLPYGGVKQSGIGLEGVRYAMESMTRVSSRVAGA